MKSASGGHTAIIYKKELLYLWRSYRLIWVPLVFLVLGISQPIATKLMPQLLSSAGSIPPELLAQLASPAPGEVLAQTLSQFNLVGVIVIALTLMGTISGEIQHGVALHYMVKAIPVHRYVLAKWMGAMSLTIPSFIIGYAGTWYYTNVLIGTVSMTPALQGGAYSLLWLMFIATLAVAVSGMIDQPAIGAVVTIIFVFVTMIMGSYLPADWAWIPSRLNDAAQMGLAGQPVSYSIAWPILSVVLLSSALLLLVVIRNTNRSSWMQQSASI
ncbi:ABC transporter permease [Paenibacillus marinisediminis]